jgi:viroplasmin and RNaseH domain-containing protein
MPYVVYMGRIPGVYVHWEDCLKQVNKFKGNNYKGYKTMAEAEARWRNHLREERRMTFGVTTTVLLTAVIAVVMYFIVV